MERDVLKKYHSRVTIEFEDLAVVEDLLGIASRFDKARKKLTKNAMESIPEEDESGARSRQAEKKRRQDKKVLRIKEYYRRLLKSEDKIEKSFKAKLLRFHFVCHKFIFPKAGRDPRSVWPQIRRDRREVTAHVANVRKKHVKYEIPRLRDFLRGQLCDEYCLMRGTPMEKKDKTWLRYGKYVMMGEENSKCRKALTKETAETPDLGDRGTGQRLDRMIDASGLDASWVMDHMEDYYAGNDHIGRWQRYVQGCRWKRLAAKLTKDIQQLEKINKAINSSNRRRCKTMSNMQNTKRQFFKRLDGARDFELSEKALKMEKRESPSNLSSEPSTSSP